MKPPMTSSPARVMVAMASGRSRRRFCALPTEARADFDGVSMPTKTVENPAWTMAFMSAGSEARLMLASVYSS